MKNRMFGIKKCFQEFGMFELGVLEKHFMCLQMPLIAFGNLFGT